MEKIHVERGVTTACIAQRVQRCERGFALTSNTDSSTPTFGDTKEHQNKAGRQDMMHIILSIKSAILLDGSAMLSHPDARPDRHPTVTATPSYSKTQQQQKQGDAAACALPPVQRIQAAKGEKHILVTLYCTSRPTVRYNWFENR